MKTTVDPKSLDACSQSFRFEVKADSVDTDARTFEGMLSTWDLDHGGDIIHQGAFKRTLKHWKQGKGRIIPLLDQHNTWGSVTQSVGKLIEAEETAEGLWTKWEVVPDDPHADAVMKRLAGGFVDGLSIGYRPVKIQMPSEDEAREGVFRHLKEVELREGSVVLWPMNDGARVDSSTVKSERIAELEAKDERTDEEDEELRLLRDGASDGLAPEDPRRVAMDEALRDLKLRRLTTRRPGDSGLWER
jgi:HK97 family phage prohead protease